MAEIVLFDRASGAVRGCSRTFAGMLHYTVPELMNRAFPSLLFDRTEEVRFAGKLTSEEENDEYGTSLATWEGTPVPVRLAWCAVSDEMCCCTVLQAGQLPAGNECDSAGGRSGHAALQVQRENMMRRGIITTVAHELRTPLQPIMGYLNLLISDPAGFGLNEETQKILARCLKSVDRERQIINKMLDLSELETGKLVLKYAEFSPKTLIANVIDASGYGTKAAISLDIPESMKVSADPDRLFVVFDSLLSNAINYSRPPRRIVISYASGTSDPFHHISVEDNGVGIAESAFLSIFEPFQLADAGKLSRTYNRIGLSLSVSQKIMELHGGKITVKSTVNAGSTFTIHIPKEVPHDT